jgi:hypothetical protein
MTKPPTALAVTCIVAVPEPGAGMDVSVKLTGLLSIVHRFRPTHSLIRYIGNFRRNLRPKAKHEPFIKIPLSYPERRTFPSLMQAIPVPLPGGVPIHLVRLARRAQGRPYP